MTELEKYIVITNGKFLPSINCSVCSWHRNSLNQSLNTKIVYERDTPIGLQCNSTYSITVPTQMTESNKVTTN